MNQAELLQQLPVLRQQALTDKPFGDDVALWFLSGEERAELSEEGQQARIRTQLGVFDLYCIECGNRGRALIDDDTESWTCGDHE